MESKTKLDMIKCRLESLVYPEEINQEILELLSDIRNDLEVLDILKKHAHSSYKKTYMYEGPVIPTNEGKFMGWVLHSIGVLILNSDKNFNKVKDWLNDI